MSSVVDIYWAICVWHQVRSLYAQNYKETQLCLPCIPFALSSNEFMNSSTNKKSVLTWFIFRLHLWSLLTNHNHQQYLLESIPAGLLKGSFIHQFIIIKRLHVASSRRITKILSSLQRLLHLEKFLKNNCNMLVVLDLSAEFGVIDHHTLVECRIHHWVFKKICWVG